MDFRIERDCVTGDIIFSGRISKHDLDELRLDRLERMVIDSPVESAHDHLQSLEIIYRRYAEQQAD